MIGRMTKAAAAILLAATPATAAEVAGVRLPPGLEVAERTLDLRGCGVREAYFLNMYVAGLYLPEPGLSQSEILSRDTTKAVRLNIVYDGALPQDVPDSWRDRLDEMVRRDVQETISDIYKGFESGDEVTVRYAPAAGTTISVNGEQTRQTDDYAVLEGLLRLWIGDRAVSENLRRLLLIGDCAG
ncbi:MAG: chalcone isomerase family protein [Acetobacterales bacterium]